MYTLDTTTGLVTRNSDNKVVSPVQSADDPDFQAYNQWANEGNMPTIVASPPPRPRTMTKLAFRRLFTLEERIAVDGAPDDQQLPYAVRSAIRTMQTDLALAEEVDLDDPDLAAGVNLLAQAGLITPARAAEILA